MCAFEKKKKSPLNGWRLTYPHTRKVGERKRVCWHMEKMQTNGMIGIRLSKNIMKCNVKKVCSLSRGKKFIKTMLSTIIVEISQHFVHTKFYFESVRNSNCSLNQNEKCFSLNQKPFDYLY